MNRTSLRLFGLVCLLAFTIPPAFSQQATGIPPFSSLQGSGFDMVNEANLNVHLAIPIVSKAGRGLPFNYALTYDSTVWAPVAGKWQPAPNWGWGNITSAKTGYVTYTKSTTVTTCPSGNFVVYTLTNWVYYDPNNTPHTFPLTAYEPLVAGESCPVSASVATDGSGFALSVNSTNLATTSQVYSRSGIDYNAPAYEGAPPAGMISVGGTLVTDTHGNTLTATVGFYHNGYGGGTYTTFFDTLNTDALTVTGGGAPTSPMVLGYTSDGTSVSGCPPEYGYGNTCIQVNYTYKTVQTNFKCSTVTDYPATVNVPLVSSISLPDGSSYTFQYEPTSAGSSNVTGRLASVTLPTGGSISYTYTGANTIECADGTAAGLTRTISPGSFAGYGADGPNGTWTYTRSGTAPNWTTKILDPFNNQTTMDFYNTYDEDRWVDQGATTYIGGGSWTCYNGASPPCVGTAVTLPITQQAVYSFVAGAGNTNALGAETLTKYNNYGLPTTVDQYGYGSGLGSPYTGGFVRESLICYAALTNTFIQDRPSTTALYSSPGNPGTCTGTSGLAAKTGFTYANTTGDELSETRYTGDALASVTRTFTYNPNGNGALQTATDFNGNQTSYTNGDCNSAFPTSIQPPLIAATTETWDCNGAVPLTVTDANKATTTTVYNDVYWRPTAVTPPATATINSTYYNHTHSPGAYNYVQQSLTNGGTYGTGLTDTTNTFTDGFGKPFETQQVATSPNIYVNWTYDAAGRVETVTNPYNSKTDFVYGVNTYSYDAVNRVTEVQHSGDSNTVLVYYGDAVSGIVGFGTQFCNSATYGLGTPMLTIDEAGNRNITWHDGLGRLIEADQANSSWESTCYGYDLLNNLTKVVQGNQTRSYNRDWLGRITSESTPETYVGGRQYSRSFYYSLNGDGTTPCSGNPGNVCMLTDERGVTTTYTYDHLNRLTFKAYSDPNTPSVAYWYDNSNAGIYNRNIQGLTNTQGRLIATCVGPSANPCQVATSETVYSYDPAGRVLSYWQCAPVNCATGEWFMGFTYDQAGDLHSWSHPDGFTITNGYNAALQLTTISSNRAGDLPGTLATLAYNHAGLLNTLTDGCYGAGCKQVVDTYGYNPRLQLNSIQVGTASSPYADTCLIYNFYNALNATSCNTAYVPGPNDNGSVRGYYYQDWSGYGLGHTATYTYDGDNRLVTAVATPVGSGTTSYNQMNFSYDQYGNMSCTGGPNNSVCPAITTDASSNHVTSVNGSGAFTYDAAGNLTASLACTYTWDAESRLSSIGECTTDSGSYDAFGRKVEWSYNYSGTSATVDWLYDPFGHRVGKYSTGCGDNGWCYDYIPMGDTWFAKYAGSALYFIHQNNIGSHTFITDVSGNPLGENLYYPWGSLWSTQGNPGDGSFAGLYALDSYGFYTTDNRDYVTNYGRWLKPDPADLGAVSLTNPQSFNRYAYALNNPASLNDPSGLKDGDCGDGNDCSGDGGSDGSDGSGGANGGGPGDTPQNGVGGDPGCGDSAGCGDNPGNDGSNGNNSGDGNNIPGDNASGPCENSDGCVSNPGGGPGDTPDNGVGSDPGVDPGAGASVNDGGSGNGPANGMPSFAMQITVNACAYGGTYPDCALPPPTDMIGPYTPPPPTDMIGPYTPPGGTNCFNFYYNILLIWTPDPAWLSAHGINPEALDTDDARNLNRAAVAAQICNSQ